jgi:orotate phosphoribosyltransferase-like protein
MEWKGDFVEGLFLSIGHTIHDIVCLNWKEVASNKQRLLNVALAMHDILIGIILVNILKAIFSDGSNKLQAI